MIIGALGLGPSVSPVDDSPQHYADWLHEPKVKLFIEDLLRDGTVEGGRAIAGVREGGFPSKLAPRKVKTGRYDQSALAARVLGRRAFGWGIVSSPCRTERATLTSFHARGAYA
jgi:hypothetical protein